MSRWQGRESQQDSRTSFRLWRVHGESMRRAGLTNRLEELGLIEPVVWVLEHLDRTFGTSIVREINLQGRVTEEYLTSARRQEEGCASGRARCVSGCECKDRANFCRCARPRWWW